MLLATRPLPWAHKQAPAATQRWSETSARHPHRWSRSSASSGSGAGAPPAAAAAAPPSTNEQQPVASPRPNGTASGNGANGSATAATAKQQARMPRVPPLPYWCSSVAVVGLPDGAIAFSFLLTEGEAAEARRGLLRTERFGGGAVKLAVVSGDKAAALLDRWQAAATRGRLATLHARPPLWQTYDSAVKGMAHRARQQQRREHLEAAAAAAVQRRQQRRQEAADAASAAAARAPSPAAAAAGAPASAAEAEAAAREPATVPALESAGSEQLGSPPPSSGQQPEASIDAPWGSSGSGGAATGWQPLAAVLVACAAVAAVLRSAAAGAWALLLAAYRRLPVGFRRLFWGTWPPEVRPVQHCMHETQCFCTNVHMLQMRAQPQHAVRRQRHPPASWPTAPAPLQWPGHASRNMATLLAHAGRGGKLAPQALEAAGFDSQGRRAGSGRVVGRAAEPAHLPTYVAPCANCCLPHTPRAPPPALRAPTRPAQARPPRRWPTWRRGRWSG